MLTLNRKISSSAPKPRTHRYPCLQKLDEHSIRGGLTVCSKQHAVCESAVYIAGASNLGVTAQHNIVFEACRGRRDNSRTTRLCPRYS